MNNFYYIKFKNNIPFGVSVFTEQVNTEVNRNFRPMTQEQIDFYLEHPNASISEIINCEVYPPYDSLDYHKSLKIGEIDQYDVSDNVNGFFLNENLVWLDKESRSCLMNTLNSADMIGREQVNIWFSGMYVTLDVDTARQMLAALEIYATDCYNVTELHKVQVNELETIEAVDAFDVTLDYPERLVFNLI